MKLRAVIPLLSFVPATLLALGYLLTPREPQPASDQVESLRERAWSLFSLYALHTISPSDLKFMKVTAALLALLSVACVGYRLIRARYPMPQDRLLCLSGVFALLALFGPGAAGGGSFLALRLALLAWMFLFFWIAAQRLWERWLIIACLTVVCAIVAASLAARFPEYRKWDAALAEFQRLGPRLRPGSTVLCVSAQRSRSEINPLVHAGGLFIPGPIIDLVNYEANYDLFITAFRPKLSPYPALGTLPGLLSVPAEFNIARYEQQAQTMVDYVVVYQPPPWSRVDPDPPVTYSDQLANYDLIDTSGPLLQARLYQRR